MQSRLSKLLSNIGLRTASPFAEPTVLPSLSVAGLAAVGNPEGGCTLSLDTERLL